MMTPENIRKLREALGLTQEQLAKRIGAGRVTVARWELGDAKPHRLYVVELEKLQARVKKKGK